ncbi:MAG: DUF4062 domain-containing protein [Candidatus Sulfotelmatobacter sp.]
MTGHSDPVTPAGIVCSAGCAWGGRCVCLPLIDRAAAAELPSADAVREWAGEKRTFISSVMAELTAERQAVAAGIRAVGMRPVTFEEFGGRDADPEEAYLAEVKDRISTSASWEGDTANP